MTRAVTPAIIAFAPFAANAAVADDDDCRSPMSRRQGRDAAVQCAAVHGMELRRLKIDDGCCEIRGRDSDGDKVKLKLEPATFARSALEAEFRRGADPSRCLAGAQAAAPTQRAAPADSPLFKHGSPPQAKNNRTVPTDLSSAYEMDQGPRLRRGRRLAPAGDPARRHERPS